jgi:hypothetical protein
MFSHVDGWAEQDSDLDDRQQSSLNCANPGMHCCLEG